MRKGAAILALVALSSAGARAQDCAADFAGAQALPASGYTLMFRTEPPKIAVGKHFTPNWRAEVFFFYGRGSDGSVTFAGVPFPQSGDASVLSAGVNVFYTFNWGYWFKPYVGAGVGVAHYDVNRIGFPGGAFAIDDSDTAIIGLLHAGLDFPLTPQLTATARYTAAFIPELQFGSVPPGTTRNVEAHISSIIFLGGNPPSPREDSTPGFIVGGPDAV